MSPAHKALLSAEILALYVRARWLMLRVEDPQALLAALRQFKSGVIDDRDALWLGVRLGRSVSRVLAPLPTDSRCFVRALVLSALLARRGAASKLVIGVSPGDRFEAHAWVEQGGIPLLPPLADRFLRLTEL